MRLHLLKGIDHHVLKDRRSRGKQDHPHGVVLMLEALQSQYTFSILIFPALILI